MSNRPKSTILKIMKIYLDDLRPIPEGYIGVRNPSEFQDLIRTIVADGTPVEEIAFDHDLGVEPSGSQLTRWLQLEVPQIFKLCERMTIHSDNSVGRRDMKRDIDNGYKYAEEYIAALDRPDPWGEREEDSQHQDPETIL